MERFRTFFRTPASSRVLLLDAWPVRHAPPPRVSRVSSLFAVLSDRLPKDTRHTRLPVVIPHKQSGSNRIEVVPQAYEPGV